MACELFNAYSAFWSFYISLLLPFLLILPGKVRPAVRAFNQHMPMRVVIISLHEFWQGQRLGTRLPVNAWHVGCYRRVALMVQTGRIRLPWGVQMKSILCTQQATSWPAPWNVPKHVACSKQPRGAAKECDCRCQALRTAFWGPLPPR